jgi:sterol carrier protein 2
MSQARQIIEQAAQRIAQDTDRVRQIGAVFRFVVDGNDGGNWLVDLKDEPGIRETGGDSDCVVALSADDFVALFDGRVSAQELFFTGRLRVTGDMGCAVKLDSLPGVLR